MEKTSWSKFLESQLYRSLCVVESSVEVYWTFYEWVEKIVENVSPATSSDKCSTIFSGNF